MVVNQQEKNLIFFQKKIKKLKCLIVNVATEPWA
jgi:hypothetical protein